MDEDKIIKEIIKEEKKKGKVKNKSNKLTITLLIILVLLVSGCIVYEFLIKNKSQNTENKNNIVNKKDVNIASYKMSGNGLEPFDLAFLKLENSNKNKAYSPISIKYALEMLSEGAKGETKTQIDSIIGEYVSNKYTNSKNMSFANSIFINNKYKDNVNNTYVSTLKDKYSAEVLYDSFSDVKTINNWVKDKTFNIIKEIYQSNDDISDYRFILNNALAIDMEWKNRIQKKFGDKDTVEYMAYSAAFAHEKAWAGVSTFDTSGYIRLDFNTPDSNNFITCNNPKSSYEEKEKNGCYDDNKVYYNAVEIQAIANKYDIVNILGEENIRKTVEAKANEWMDEHNGSLMINGIKKNEDGRDDVNDYLDKYISEISKNYKHVSSSTDFMFYDDENIKVFAKDLKEYDGTTLQYVGIMPKTEKLNKYIEKLNANDLNKIIKNLKDISLESFEEGYVTKIIGYIPMFRTEDELDLMKDLKLIGITDVFDINKADLSNICPLEDTYIDNALHRTNIEFSNDGIKAASATTLGGNGNLEMYFDYIYDVPEKQIDLTFDNPFMYLIRDKKLGEVWFIGTVYEPIRYSLGQ